MDPIAAAGLVVAAAAGKPAASEAGKQGITALVRLVRSKFAGSPADQQVLEAAQARPDDEAATQRLVDAIRSHADQDPRFATELTELANQPQAQAMAKTQAQAMAQQATGSVIIRLRDQARISKQINIGSDFCGDVHGSYQGLVGDRGEVGYLVYRCPVGGCGYEWARRDVDELVAGCGEHEDVSLVLCEGQG